MGFRINTEYPLWLVIFSLAAGFLYSFFLYRKDRHFADLNKNIVFSMMIFRFISVTFISFLLLNPLVKNIKQSVRKPIIIIAQDNSESILLSRDSVFYRTAYKNDIKELVNDLSKDYDVKTYVFGQEVNRDFNINYKEKGTDISTLFSEVNSKFSGSNVGAMIFVSDGIYNSGSNPVYNAAKIRFPVYSVMMGDTGIQKDLVIADVRYNRTAFLNNKFPVSMRIEAGNLTGQRAELAIFDKDKKVFSREININSSRFTQQINAELNAEKKGLLHLVAKITTLKEEKNVKNNSTDIVINVNESKQSILVLYNSPHPDVAAISSVIKKNPNFETESFSIEKFNKPVSNYSLIILHQLPSNTNSVSNLLNDIEKYKIPVLFVVGVQTSLESLNSMNTGIKIMQAGKTFEEATVLPNKQFTYFTINDAAGPWLEKTPPLICPFGEYLTNAPSEILFFQKIKNIPTSKPLILLCNMIDTKFGFIMGEGIWKWRLNDNLMNSNSQLFDEIVNKIVQFLTLREKRERFELNSQNFFNENEAVTFDSRVRNVSFEPISTPDVFMEIINEKGQKFPFVFNKNDNQYQLNAGHFPVGEYNYNAKVKTGNEDFSKQGKFSIIPVNIEALNSMADHKLLRQLASSTKGKTYYPHDLKNIAIEIRNNKDIIPILYSEKYISDLINNKWIFFILAGFLFIEWFFRKFFGGY